MKTRNGFVSNSSSSSFVIRRGEWALNKNTGKAKLQIIITDKQETALVKFGFRKTVAHSPSQIPPFYDKKAWIQEDKWVERRKGETALTFNFGYEITCNQDEVMVFLIKNKIPFVASCHYGHESFVYVPKTDTLYQGTNYGSIMETYGPSGSVDAQPPGVKVFKGKNWMKNNK